MCLQQVQQTRVELFTVRLFSSIQPLKTRTEAAQLTGNPKKEPSRVTHWVWKLRAVLWALFLVHNCKYFSK